MGRSRSSERRFLLVAVAIVLPLLVAAALAPGNASAEDDHKSVAIALQNCLLSGVNFPDQRQRLVNGGWVPEDYPFQPSTHEALHPDPLRTPHPRAWSAWEPSTRQKGAVVLIWTFGCDSASVGDRSAGSAKLSIVGVALKPDHVPHLLGSTWPGSWGIYVVDIFGDNRQVMGRLARAGMPTHVVPDMSFEEEFVVPRPDELPDESIDVPLDAETCTSLGPAPGLAHSPPNEVKVPESNKSTTVRVQWARSSFETTTMPHVHHNAVTHCHDQVLWHGPYEEAAKLRLVIPVARDHFCTTAPGCGSAKARPDTRIADFLDGGFRDSPRLAFDHEPIVEVRLEEL